MSRVRKFVLQNSLSLFFLELRALHARHRLAAGARLAGVETDRQRGRRVRPRPAHRRLGRTRRPKLGAGAPDQDVGLLELAAARDAGDLLRLRQRGSPESKPVGTPHDATGVRVMNLDDGQSVAAVAPVLQSEDDASS